MEPYFIFLAFIFACAGFDYISKQKTNIFKVLVFIGLTLFAGLRSEVGIDYESYAAFYLGLKEGPLHEPGSALLMELLGKINGTVHLYFLIMAIVTEFFVYITVIKEKKIFWLTVVMYYCISIFYFASFNGVRNFAAIAIMTWALKYAENRDFKRFLIISLITGFTFHYSALIFIPLYFYLRYRLSIKQIVLISIVVILGGGIIFVLLKYTPYAKYERFMEDDTRQNTVELIHYIFAALSLSIILWGRKFKYLSIDNVLYNINTLSFYTILMVIQQSSGTFMMLFQRFNNYFLFGFLLIVPKILMSMQKDNRSFAKVFLILFSFAYFIRTIVFKGEHHMLVPYNFDFTLFAH